MNQHREATRAMMPVVVVLASLPAMASAAEPSHPPRPADAQPFPLFRVSFDDEGNFVSRVGLNAVLDEVRRKPPTHLFVLAHGWNNNFTESQASYARLIELLAGVATRHRLHPSGYRPLFVGIHWPSKAWDPDRPRPEGARRDPADEENELVTVIKENFPPSRSPRTYAADVARFRELLARPGPVTEEEKKEALALMRRYTLPPSPPEEDSIFDHDDAALPPAEGNANPIRQGFRAFTFWQMKKRAGIVGQKGVHELLEAVQEALAGSTAGQETKVCLVGHSFGSKLVLAAVADRGAPLVRPVQALVLIQGALSHEAFAARVSRAQYPGAYRSALSPERVRGPVLVTFTRHDTPLNWAYPLGARFGGPLGEAPSRYSALGAIGAHESGGRQGQEVPMKAVGEGRYDLGTSKLWSVAAHEHIGGHSEIYNEPTAWLIWAAVLPPHESDRPAVEGRRPPTAVTRSQWLPQQKRLRVTVELKDLERGQLYEVPEPVRGSHSGEAALDYYLFPRIGGAGTLQDAGKPELPVVTVAPLDLPLGAKVTLAVQESESVAEVWDNLKIAPARLPWSEKPGALRPPRFGDHAVYATDEFYPARLVKPGPHVGFRETSGPRFYFHPVQYNPVERRVKVYKKLVALLEVKEAEAPLVASPAPERPAGRPLSHSSVFAQTYTQMWNEYRPPQAPTVRPEAGSIHYLAVVPDEMASALEPLLQAKRDRNLKVKSIKLSEVPDNNDPAKRRQLLKQRILREAAASANLAFLLLVGDASKVPPFVGSHPDSGDLVTDLYYATLGSSWGQYVPDLAVGRLPARNADELKIMVDKVLRYEKALDEAKRGGIIVAAEHENSLYQKRDGQQITSTNRWFLQTADSIRSFLATNGQAVHWFYVASEPGLGRPWYYFDTVTRVPDLDFLEHGPAVQGIVGQWAKARLVFHRDHGQPEGWAAPPFQLSEVRRLPKPAIPPVVFSINCDSGCFDRGPNEPCFAEELMRQANGASGVIASTRISYSGYNDRLAEGLMMGIWPTYVLGFNPAAPRLDRPQDPRLGEILNSAKSHVDREYPHDTYTRLTFEMFHCFGDPEMRVLTSTLAGAQRPEGPRPEQQATPVIKFQSSFPEGYK